MKLIRAVTLALTLSASAMTAFSAHAAPQDGGSLVIGVTGVPRHFNGAIQSGTATALPSTQIFASPLRYDENWDPEPYLAQSWETSDDGLTVTLNLVHNALFHDGTPVTSEDVKFSIETIKANHPFQTMLAPVESIDTPDEYTVVIHLSHPHPALLLAMSPALMPILPEHVYAGDDIQNNPANLKPVGSGPFEFVEYKQGEYVKLKKFDKFFIEGRPHLDEVYIQMFGDANNLLLATQHGEVDDNPFVSSSNDISTLEDDPNVVVERKGGEAVGAINWLAFNTKKAPFDNVKVRQAIAYAINRDFIINVLFKGSASPAYGPIVPSSPLATDDVEHYDFDLDKAASLLDEAGYPADADGNRFTVTMDYIPGLEELGRNVAEYMRSQLRQIGVTVEVRTSPDFPTWASRISNYDFDMTEDDVFNWGDPVIGVNRTYLSSNIRKGVIWSNTQQYSNPRVDELLEQAAEENDPEKRKELYKEFQQIVVSDAPITYLNVVPYYTAHNPDLKGLPLGIWGTMAPLDTVYWDKK